MCLQGNGVEVNLDKLGKCPGFGDFKDEMFLDMCILSGCDYVSFTREREGEREREKQSALDWSISEASNLVLACDSVVFF